MSPSGTESEFSGRKAGPTDCFENLTFYAHTSPSYPEFSGRKPGLQTASKASLSMHIQAPATCPAVFPNEIDCDASSAVDSSVKSVSVGDSVGSVEDAVLHVC